MEITLPVIIKHPDTTKPNIFSPTGTVTVPGSTESFDVIVNIDPLIEKIVEALKDRNSAS